MKLKWLGYEVLYLYICNAGSFQLFALRSAVRLNEIWPCKGGVRRRSTYFPGGSAKKYESVLGGGG